MEGEITIRKKSFILLLCIYYVVDVTGATREDKQIQILSSAFILKLECFFHGQHFSLPFSFTNKPQLAIMLAVKVLRPSGVLGLEKV